LVHIPEMRPYAGKSDIVHIKMALILNFCCYTLISAEASNASMPSHSICSSSINGARKMLMLSELGDSFPEIRILSKTKNFFVRSHGGRL
jgi:hypothetical protein